MWNKSYDKQYDRWENREYNGHSHRSNSSGSWGRKQINFCPSCGEQLVFPNTKRKSNRWDTSTQYQRKNQQYDQDTYNQDTYQNSSSCSSVLVPVLVVITIIIVIASCNIASSSSVSSALPVVNDVNVEYKSNTTESGVSNVAYKVSDLVLTNDEYVQVEDQINQPAARTYMVKPGDTVYRIAVEVLGDGSRWVEIDQLNNLGRLSNGSVLIHPGQELILPD